MDSSSSQTNRDETIRKIEDIIDIQKANGNFTMRQVAFSLPTDSESNVSAGLAKSLESGLTKIKTDALEKKKLKKYKSKRFKTQIADVISWPSDSDITVLRMKLCLSADIKNEVALTIPGDGLHQADGCSMVNLATLMRQSQPPSKQSIIEEYLLPLSSWEKESVTKGQIAEKISQVTQYNEELEVFNAAGSSEIKTFCLNDSENQSETSTKSKIARFLRLYFCPCCTCLYRMENLKMHDEQSVYWTQRKEPMNWPAS